jgi:hypothetical protein
MLPHGQRSTVAGIFDLDEADRSDGMYQRVFHRLTVRPNGGPPGEVLRMGDRLRLEVAVEDLYAMPPHAAFVVAISSHLDQQLLVMSSGMIPLHALHDRQRHETVVLDIPSLPLTPGEYKITLRLSAGPETIDFIHEAAEFTVEPADVLGTGYRYQPVHNGAFVLPWDWELRPTTDQEHYDVSVQAETGDGGP